MSSTHLSIRKKQTEELIAVKIFCKNSAVEEYLENSTDEKIKHLEYRITIHSDINKDTIDSFLEQLDYAICYLENISVEERLEKFEHYFELEYENFIEDLKQGKAYLEDFKNTHNLEEYDISLI